MRELLSFACRPDLAGPILLDLGPETLLNPDRLTCVFVLAIAVVALVKGWVVPGVYYEDVKKQLQKALDRNDELLGLNRSAVDVTASVVSRSRPAALPSPPPAVPKAESVG